VKRRLIIAAIVLLAGTVVNVAVAWGCAAWSPVECGTLIGDVFRRQGIGFQIMQSKGRTQGIPWTHVYWRTAAGFPALCLDGGLLENKISEDGNYVRKLPSANQRWLIHYEGTLPVHPVWPGFLVNTLFYAIILWLLIPGPFVLRRLIRVRRDLCPKCTYPMGESAVCTECGRKLPKQAGMVPV